MSWPLPLVISLAATVLVTIGDLQHPNLPVALLACKWTNKFSAVYATPTQATESQCGDDFRGGCVAYCNFLLGSASQTRKSQCTFGATRRRCGVACSRGNWTQLGLRTTTS